MKVWLIIIVLIMAIASIAFYYVHRQAAVPPVSRPTSSDMIRISTPVGGALVQSPLTVTGEARGNWYFEASFPVRILDANGAELGVVSAQAQGDWMTTEFVPFKATLAFSTSTTETGTLVFEKDNPSGLTENAAEVRIPIRLK